MATSIHSGIVDVAASLYGTDDDPVENWIARDGVANGLLHAADSMAQVRVNYNPIASGVANGQDSFETIESGFATGTYYKLGASPFGEWPLTLHADGSGYKLRIRVGGSTSNAAGTVVFRVVIAPPGVLADAEREASGATADHIFTTAGTASTTPGNLTGTTTGTGNATLMTISYDRIQRWIQATSVYDAVSSPAAGASVQQCLVAAHVWAKTTHTSGAPRLNKLYIAEYVGT